MEKSGDTCIEKVKIADYALKGEIRPVS